MNQSNNIQPSMNGNELLKIAGVEIPRLVDPILPKVGLASLVGNSEVGKSTWLLSLAISIVDDSKEFLDFDLNKDHKRVLYVSTEDEQHAVANRLAKQLKLIDELDGDKKPKKEFLDNLDFIFEPEVDGEPAKVEDAVARKLESKNYDLVIVDAFSDCFFGNINSLEVRQYMNKYKPLAQDHQCLFLFLHHYSKRRNKPDKDNILGSQGYEAKNRVILSLESRKNEPHIRDLCILKHNYESHVEKEKVYELEFDSETLNFKHTGVINSLDDVLANKVSLSQPEILLRDYSEVVEEVAGELTLSEGVKKLDKLGFKTSDTTLHKAVNQFKKQNNE